MFSLQAATLSGQLLSRDAPPRDLAAAFPVADAPPGEGQGEVSSLGLQADCSEEYCVDLK